MGWFLSKNSPKKGKKQSTSGKGKQTGSSTAKVKLSPELLRPLIVLAALLALSVTWYFSEQYLEQLAWQAELVRPLTPEMVVIEQPPAFLGESSPEIAELKAIAAGAGFATELQPAGDRQPVTPDHDLPAIHKALVSHPWIAAIDRLERRQGQLIVHAQFRRPVALVEADDNSFDLIDGQGTVLRQGYDAGAALAMRTGHGLAVIVETNKPSPGPGHVWQDTPVQQAIALHQYLKQNWDLAHQVVAIDVGADDWRNQTRLMLRTDFDDPQAGIIWGSAPGQERPMESPADLKLKWLTTNAMSYQGHIDGHGQCFAVDRGQFQSVHFTSGG